MQHFFLQKTENEIYSGESTTDKDIAKKRSINSRLKEQIERAFNWKNGMERHTDGIYILTKPILIPPKNPEVFN